MKNHSNELKWNIVLAMLAAAGVAAKQLIAPAINLLTDVLFIPGGSVSTGISICFLLLGTALSPQRFTGTRMALIQGGTALILGASSFQGIFILVSYAVPGLVIDGIMASGFRPLLGNQACLSLAGICAVVSGSLITNSLFFQLEPLPLFLFLGMGALSGFFGGKLSFLLVERLRSALQSEGYHNNTENT